MEQCRKCLIESKYYGLEMDSYGVCSCCKIIDKFPNLISQIGKQEKILQERLSLFRNIGQYDCLVGLSGGKDSSYMIYRLKSYYGARVLAYTCDKGFLTEYAKKNIDAIVEEFGIDHIWVRPNDIVLRTMFARNLNNECWPCSACFLMSKASAWKLAYENRIPYIVSGRAPEQILRKPNTEFFESPYSLINDNLASYDKNRVHKLAVGALQEIEMAKKWLLPDKRLWQVASDDLYLKSSFSIPDDFAPEWLGFFLYEEHNESYIMNILERETSWEGPENRTPLSHYDCEAHDAAAYLYYRMHGTTFTGLEISALIRQNKLSLKEGQDILRDEVGRVSTYPRESILSLSEVSGIHPFNIRLLPKRIKARNYLKSKIKKLYLKSRS